MQCSSQAITTRFGSFQRDLRNGRLSPDQPDVEYEDSLRAAIGEAIDPIGSQLELRSLDVFDTLLIRKPHSELRRFFEIAERQAVSIDPAPGSTLDPLDLLVARLQATQSSYGVSRPVKGCREGSIDEIYSVVAETLGLSPAHVEQLISIELAYECEVLEPNWALVEVIQEIGPETCQTILVSDMYLRSSDIAFLVDHFALKQYFPMIVSSAETKVTKASYQLFPELVRKLEFNPACALHLGDNFRADYLAPRHAGMSALHLPTSSGKKQLINDDYHAMENEISLAGINITRWIRQ